MRQYPIWNEINSCAYASGNKSYGVKSRGYVSVRIGTGASCSHGFVRHEVTRRVGPNEHDQRVAFFRFYVFDFLVKETQILVDKNDCANGAIVSEKTAYIGKLRKTRQKVGA